VRQALTAIDGVVTAEVLFDEERADVRYDPARATPERLVQAVEEIGFVARMLEGESR
jgi:copper chaperone CopZ